MPTLISSAWFLWTYNPSHERKDTNDNGDGQQCECMKTIHQLEDELIATPAQHMVLDLAMATGTTLDFSRGKKPVWLILEGNSGSGKTYTVELLEQYQSMVYRGKLTAAGMASGYVDSKGGTIKGLFRELDNKCLVLTELGKTLSLTGNELKALMGTLASAFDGTVRDQVGTQDYQGDLRAHFALLACGTPATLANHRSALEPIGTRFLHFRLRDVTREELKERQRARKAVTHRAEKEAAIKTLVHEHLSHLSPVPEELPAWPDALDDMTEFLSMARAAVRRDEQGQPYTVDPEDPDRATHQLNCLGLALARLYGRKEIGDDELDLLWQVTLASVPTERLLVLGAVAEGPLNAEQVASATGLKRTTTYNTLNPLCWAGLVEREEGKTNQYSVSEHFDGVASKLALAAGFPVRQKTIITQQQQGGFFLSANGETGGMEWDDYFLLAKDGVC